MDIRQYQMHDRTHHLSLPRGAKFRGARHAGSWSVLFFEHAADWTNLERWDLVLVPCDSSPVRVVGGTDDQFEFLHYTPASMDNLRGDMFLYRKIA